MKVSKMPITTISAADHAAYVQAAIEAKRAAACAAREVIMAEIRARRAAVWARIACDYAANH